MVCVFFHNKKNILENDFKEFLTVKKKETNMLL